MGNLTSTIEFAGRSAATTQMVYEPVFNQMSSLTDPLNHTTEYEYDSTGNLIKITDPLDMKRVLHTTPKVGYL